MLSSRLISALIRDCAEVADQAPSFPALIYANLVAVDGGYALVWSH